MQSIGLPKLNVYFCLVHILLTNMFCYFLTLGLGRQVYYELLEVQKKGKEKRVSQNSAAFDRAQAVRKTLTLSFFCWESRL